MNDTPRTDEVFGPELFGMRSNLCRTLERELAAAIRELAALKSQFTKLDKPKYSGAPMMDSVLATRNPEFDAWVASLPATYWTRYDLSAARIGWEAALQKVQS
jgi:hypothetical protein